MIDNKVWLHHIKEEADLIVQTIANLTEEEFHQSVVAQHIVIRALEVIGEAAKHVSDDFRTQHPEIAWRGMCGLRDRLIHAYFAVDLEKVWEISTTKIPELVTQVDSLLK
ncbi:MAG: DUF86 domain-containing protein [Methanocorpusculum parvum]|nr:DUF86 domain-containing protein [Methanocorpusculum parvum]